MAISAVSRIGSPPGEVFASRQGEISQAPTRRQLLIDRLFRSTCLAFAGFTIVLVTFIVLRIAFYAAPAMSQYGVGFLTGRVWDPNTERYGILAEMWGTVFTSILALGLGSAFGIAAAIFLSEGFLGQAVFGLLRRMKLELHPVFGRLPDQGERLLKNLIELLAAIPSVVYGLWGLFVVIPLIRPACNWLHLKLGWIPFFSTDLSGPGVLPAVIVLSIMILPTITAISRDALVSVPSKLRMAVYGLGATRWETILSVILPTASRGVVGGVLLALGRALGETMALAMLAGNSNQISVSLFSPANTLAALLANNFPEASARQVGVLMYAALVLLGITLVVNILGALVIQRASLSHADWKVGDIVSASHEQPPGVRTIEDPFAGIDFGELERSLRRPRTLMDFVLSGAVAGMTMLSLIPLFSVVIMLLWRGGRKLSLAVFTELPPAALEQGGGFGNAIVGTLIIVAIAVLLSVPVGLLTAIYLAQNQRSRLGGMVRFSAKVLTGFPSILAGVFAYGAIVLTTGGYSAVAGAVALSILMLPTIILTSEDAIRMVPSRMKDAAIGMGATRTQTVWMVLLPTAMPGILTGIMLAVARAAGETAPLLFTALFSNYWLWSNGRADLWQPTASLAVLVYNFAGQPFENQVELAWAAALVLVLIVLAANLVGQSLSSRRAQHS